VCQDDVKNLSNVISRRFAQTGVEGRRVPEIRHHRFGLAWVALTLCLAAHVVDEALTGFLDVYNPIVQSMRARFPWFPMPVFTFDVWIAGLCLAVGVLFALSPLAYRQSPFLRVAAYPYAALMVLNGAAHLLGSVYLHRWAPGATTAPLLIASSLWLLAAAGSAQQAFCTDSPRRRGVPENRHRTSSRGIRQ